MKILYIFSIPNTIYQEKKGRFSEKTGDIFTFSQILKGQETTPVPFVTYEALRICGIFLYFPNN